MQMLARGSGIFDSLFSWILCSLAAIKLVIVAAVSLSIVDASAVLAKDAVDGVATPHGPPIVCTGKDLLASLKVTDPEALARLDQAAAKVPFGNARFWKIEKEGLATSWLLGTMHFADPRVINMPPALEEAFQAAGTVIIENTKVLDEEAMMAAMAELRPMMFLTDGSTLEKYYSRETIDLIKKRLKGRDVPYYLGKRMQPWVLATSLVLPMCEVERKRRKEKVLDYVLGTRARDEGKKLVGLESVAEQIGAMAGLSFEFHLRSLEESIKLGSRLDDMMETMVNMYQRGEIGKIWPLMGFLSPETSRGPDYEAFKFALITRRNKTMADRSIPVFEKGGAFMAVGALHLPGEKGVVKLLVDAGYKLTPVF